ncbi:MAG: stage II sporulation protein R [Christensenellaceae bacterium]|jgi:stage II sporulation protein R|nr:stage II sporulation protein R [Christensenellaceae bacterium]
MVRFKWFSVLLAALALLWGVSSAQSMGAREATCASRADILRLHIIANSDSEADQAAKLAVRDAILQHEARFAGSADSADALGAAILSDGEGLLRAAQASLRQSGMPYGARLSLGTYAFPRRDYAGKVYPAGAYRALRIVLGEGGGKNWWCVLFPPLCILELPAGEIEGDAMDFDARMFESEAEAVEFKSFLLEQLHAQGKTALTPASAGEEPKAGLWRRILQLWRETT